MKFRENVMINTNQMESIIRKLPKSLKEHVSLGFCFWKKNVKKIKCILRKLPASLMEQVSIVFFFKKKTQKIIAKKFPEARVNMRKKKN